MNARRILADQLGASAAEFALVLPLLCLLLFGIIDAGRWMWSYNEMEKATQTGARVASATQIIPSGIAGTWVGQTVNGTVLTQGDNIPVSAIGTIACTKAATTLSCSCTGVNLVIPSGVTNPASCPGTINSTGWDAILSRMKNIYPEITDANVEVDYKASGLGYAGDPDGLNISPLITVRLRGLSFRPLSLLMITSIKALPAAATTISAEDELGTQSN